MNCPSPPLLTQALTHAQTEVNSATNAYNAALESHYYTTTAAQAFLLVGIGDALSQAIEGRGQEDHATYDAVRTLRMASLGLVIGGFGTACWLRHLEDWLPGHATGARVLQKASIDAGLWAPFANTAYLVLVPLLEGKSERDVSRLLKERFVPVMQTELMTFFPYNLVSFSMIAPLYRPFTTGFVSCCFAVFISYVTHTSQADEAAAGAEERASEVGPALVGE